MIKKCPIMSYQKQYKDEIYCMESECAFWDEKSAQCCIKTMALAAAENQIDKVREQATYIPVRSTSGQKPQEYNYNSETGEANLADQYIFNGGL